jgi:hypothetical protein
VNEEAVVTERDELYAGQILEMPIAGQKVGAMRQGGRINDRVRCRQLVLGA